MRSTPSCHTTPSPPSPVIPFGQQPLVLIASPAKGYKSLRDLVTAGKAKPGALNYSSAGVGSASHFAAERLRISAGFTAQHIPFPGAAEAVTEVVAERADFSAQLPSTTLQLIGKGKLVALAVSADKRAASLPQVPTTLEAGLTADSIYPFYSGLFMHAKTPRAVVEKLHQEAAKAMQEPSVQECFKQLGVEAMPMSVAQFETFFKEDIKAAVALVKAADIPKQ
jgi:tripartite-type tricarboxylate transporter receptor subunit TctC